MSKNSSSHLDELQVEALKPNTDHGTKSSISSIRTSVKVGFFIGQAIILLSFPIEILAAFIKLPSFAEAQANEGLILALCAYIPFVIICEIVAWVAFVKKQMFGMILATMAALLALAVLVLLAIYTV
jgi:uncharacterized membrane protein